MIKHGVLTDKWSFKYSIQKLNYYILIVGESFDEYKSIDPYDELSKRLNNNFWYIYRSTKYAEEISKNDKVLFYASGLKNKKIYGSAKIFSKEKVLKKVYKTFTSDIPIYCLNFTELTNFKIPKPMIDKLPNTEFFKKSKKKNISKWGVYLMGGVRKISKKDYDYLVK